MRTGRAFVPARFRMKSLHVIVLVCLSLSLFHCNEKMDDSPKANQLPRSFLWLYPDSSVGIGVSRQHLRWWGEDPDGVIRGYLFGFVPFRFSGIPNPDTIRYTWTSENDTIIQFPLDTLFRYYTVFVRAVDNTFPGLPEKSVVRLAPSPYIDRNENGIFDGGDEALPGLSAAMDQIGTFLAFPIRNTPPTIAFAQNPNEPGTALRLPDSTFTAVSIGFKGTDADGDNTLASYRIALNDTSNPANWLTLRLRDTLVTLVVPRSRSDIAPGIPGTEVTADVYSGRFLGRQLIGQLPGLRLDAPNVVFLQAWDIAGESSPVIRIPSATDSWRVKRPRGKVLLVSDYTRNDSGFARSTYVNTLRAVPDPQFDQIDFLNIAAGIDITRKQRGEVSRMVPPYVDPALVNTFLLYDYVFLYTDEIPSLSVIQSVPFYYLQNGGKMLFSAMFSADFTLFNPTAILREFAPIDSVSSVFLGTPHPFPSPGDNRIRGASKLYPDSSIATNIYPRLAFNGTRSTTHLFFWRDMYRRTDARVIYRLEPDSLSPIRYNAVDPRGEGDALRPKVAVVDGQGRIAFFGLPLHLLNNTSEGNQGLTPLFTKLFTQHFSPYHRVDRRTF